MRGLGTKRYSFLFLLLLLAITGFVFIGTDSFHIRDIVIQGNHRISSEDIIAKAGIPKNLNIFKLDKGLIKDRIEAEPYLELVTIKRRYPREVIITVREKEAAAIIPYLNSYYIIDLNCFIMEIVGSLEDLQYPLIQGIQVQNFTVGKRLLASEEYQLKALSRILEAIGDLDLEDQVSEIIMDNPDDIEFILTEGTRVRIGQAIKMDEKLVWLKSQEIIDVCGGLKRGILDLSVPSKPVFHSDES